MVTIRGQDGLCALVLLQGQWEQRSAIDKSELDVGNDGQRY